MIFDTWGGLLSHDAYRAFLAGADARASLDAPARRRACRRSCSPRAAARGSPTSPACGATCVGLDWTVDLAAARAAVGARVALQGNLDPLVLLDRPRDGRARSRGASSRAAGPAPGHVFNLGHGIVPATPPEHVAALVEAVHATSRESAPVLEMRGSHAALWVNGRKPAPVLALQGLDKRRQSGIRSAVMHIDRARSRCPSKPRRRGEAPS